MTWFKNISIKNKLIIIILSVSIASISVGFFIDILNLINTFKNDMINNTVMTAKVIGEYSVTPLVFEDQKGAHDILSKLSAFNNIDSGILYNEKDDIFATYTGSNDNLTEPASFSKIASSFFDKGYLHVFQPIVYKKQNYGTIYIKAHTVLLSQKIRKHINLILFLLLGLTAVSFLLANKVQRIISVPILNLANVTREITKKGDYSFKVKKRYLDEVGDLYDGFNEMLEQIYNRTNERERMFKTVQEKNKELEQVVYVSSHDLRTPLVNIQGFGKELNMICKDIITVLSDENLPVKTKENLQPILKKDIPECLRYITGSATKMGILIEGLLQLTRIGRQKINYQNINLKELLNSLIKNFTYQFNKKNIKIKVMDIPDCKGDKVQMGMIFSNLIQNAIKYTHPDRPGEIIISGYNEDNSSVFCVEDNGIGIPDKYQKVVFKMFHRLNPTLSDGEGLGLAIVEKILEQHHGKIWIESKESGGTKIFFSIPKHIPIIDEEMADSAPANNYIVGS